MHLVEKYQNSKIQWKYGGIQFVASLVLEDVDEWGSIIKIINLIIKKTWM